MASNRVTGLASAFDDPKPASTAPSAITSIASRFESSKPAEPAKLSDKVSDLANKFGAVVEAGSPLPSPRAPRRAPSKPKSATPTPPAPAPEPEPERRAVHDISKAFSEQPAPAETRFAAAADAFRRREAAERPAVESRVTQVARAIEDAKKKGADAPRPATDPSPNDAPAGVVGARERFEGASAQDAPEQPSVKDRFASAAKMFETGSAGVREEKGGEGEGAGEGDSAKNRFADAARLFGGS